MNIALKSIPHKEQRYETCGDWVFFPNGSLSITVSDTGNEDHAFLVALHEMVEAWLCQKRGIPEQSITDFDVAYEAARPEGDDSEPGDQPDAPYQKEHQFATKIERMMAEELGVDWDEYENALYAL